MATHFFLGTSDSVEVLRDELGRAFPSAVPSLHPSALVGIHGSVPETGRWPAVVFARQILPHAEPAAASSIRLWAELLAGRCLAGLPEGQPWRLHVYPHFGGQAEAGRHRCDLIQKALREHLRQRHRRTLRALDDTDAPFTPAHSLVQLVLTSPETGFLSLARAPFPFGQRHVMAASPEGDIPGAVDKAAPSRAFAKLVEAEARLGVPIPPGGTCVDLGASPGSWSYTALKRGAQVVAVDRSPLREDLMRHPRLEFARGDAFRFEPRQPVDWLLCDVIATPDRSIALLERWLERRWCGAFVVTIKFKGTADYRLLDSLKALLPARCETFVLTRLCANRNEACAAGIVRRESTVPANLRLSEAHHAGSIPPSTCPDGPPSPS